MNIKLAELVLKKLVQLGVKEICLCAGARNSPFVYLLEESSGIEVFSFFDERSAAFFAIGKSKALDRPVAVITTSGTAVAELLPAAVEATYSGVPLILVTADRPRSYRGKGAPQSIEQCGIFSKYVEKTVDIESENEYFDVSDWSLESPLHINVCFDEPLIDAEIPKLDFLNEKAVSRSKMTLGSSNKRILRNPLVIVGEIKPNEKEQVLKVLQRLKAPIYAEGISNLRGEDSIKDLLLNGGEKSVEKVFESSLATSVLRLGGIPTLRFWRDLETKYEKTPVYSCSASDWTGLSRSVHHMVGLSNLEHLESEINADQKSKIFELDLNLADQIDVLIEAHPDSEVGFFAELSKITESQSVYLGNSLPIREWDIASSTELKHHRISGNRGANGIDGQISTFLGWAAPETENWCIVGDLTAMYDLSAPWISNKIASGPLRVVIVNNNGGQIFKKMFKKKAFLNSHEIQFKNWADMWGWDYVRSANLDASLVSQIKNCKNVIIELVPSVKASDDFWMGYQLIK